MWDVLMRRMGEIPNIVGQPYGYSAMCPEAAEGEFEYVAGFEVGQSPDVPEGMVRRDLPAARYAAFSTTLPTVMTDSETIYTTWLPQAGLEPATDWMFEYYPPTFQGDDSPFEIWVPIK